MSRKVSYGQTFDEFVLIDSFSDEIRFKLCMKLYKTHTTVAKLENAIKKKSLSLIESSI